MGAVSVFQFFDYADYLRVISDRHRSREQRTLTLSQWARRLGYRSPRSVAMVLKKQRLPTHEMIRRMSDQFRHSDSEHRYFELLVQLERSRKDGSDASPIVERLRDMNPSLAQGNLLDAESFAYVAEWYHLVIKQLVDTRGFRDDPFWIAAQLKHRVTPAQAAAAISAMLRLGILERAGRTKRLRVAKENLRTTSDIPNEAIRQHHRGMLARALDSLEEDDVETREISSSTFCLDPRRIKEAKEEIRRFKQSFSRKFAAPSGGAVHQLNVQLFGHTT